MAAFLPFLVEQNEDDVPQPQFRIRRPRHFMRRDDPLAIPDKWIIMHYRLCRAQILQLNADLGPLLEPQTRRSKSFPSIYKILVTLRYLSTGTFQNMVGNAVCVSRPRASIFIDKNKKSTCKPKNLTNSVSTKNPLSSFLMRGPLQQSKSISPKIEGSKTESFAIKSSKKEGLATKPLKKENFATPELIKTGNSPILEKTPKEEIETSFTEEEKVSELKNINDSEGEKESEKKNNKNSQKLENKKGVKNSEKSKKRKSHHFDTKNESKRKRIVQPFDSLSEDSENQIVSRRLGNTRIDYSILKPDIYDELEIDNNMMNLFEDEENLKEFRKEKARQEEENKPKDTDLFLQGWGSWGGPGITISKQKREKFMIKAEETPKRKYSRIGHVIYNEQNDVHNNIRKKMVSEIPYPFARVQDFEASMRHPLGRKFVPESEHRKLIAPPVVTKMGAIIRPIDEEALLSQRLAKFKKSELEKKIEDELKNSSNNNRLNKNNGRSKKKSKRISKPLVVNN